MRLIALFVFLLPTILAAQIHKGGNGNGFGSILTTSLILSTTDSLYNGGNGTGFSTVGAAPLLLGLANGTYNGGAGNGFSSINVAASLAGVTDSLYNGGNGKGETLLNATLDLTPCGVVVRWNGLVSNVWSDGGNWDCGFPPGVNSNVVIPTGLPRYPTVFADAEIKGILVQNGAALTVRPAVQLKVNGQ